jgi:hypothetical protein
VALDAPFTLIGKAGHLPHLEKLDRTLAVVTAFLAEVPRAHDPAS